MLPREVVVVEVRASGIVHPADIDNGDAQVVELVLGGLSSDDGSAVLGGEQADGEQVVFVGATGMRDNQSDHGMGIARLLRPSKPPERCGGSQLGDDHGRGGER